MSRSGDSGDVSGSGSERGIQTTSSATLSGTEPGRHMRMSKALKKRSMEPPVISTASIAATYASIRSGANRLKSIFRDSSRARIQIQHLRSLKQLYPAWRIMV